jgi:phage terminase large subunit-like protein
MADKQLVLNADTRRFVRFARRYLRFVEGEVGGQPVEFEPWLVEQTNNILSRDPATGLRRYRVAYLGLAKKNNKSTWGAALALFFLVVESAMSDDKGMQVYAIAASKDQAKIVFNAAKRMVEASPLLSDYLTVHRDAIYCPQTGARFEVLSADAPKTHGKNPSIVICDELHAHENGELYDAMLTAMVARREPLMVIVTNAGANERGDSKCAEVYRRGKSGDDPSMYFYSPTVGDDEIDDPANWKQANPASWITVEKLVAMSKSMPWYRFCRFHLNRWTRAEKDWLPRGAWAACDGGTRPQPGERAVLGIDMSKNHDTTAIGIIAPRRKPGTTDEDGKRYAAAVETFGAWSDANADPPEVHHVIEGDTIPFDAVFDRVRELCAEFDVVEIAYDRWRIPEVVSNMLEAEGLPMVEFPQQPQRMCPASQGLFDVVVNRQLEHDGDMILEAHIAAATPRDVGRGWRLDKDASRSPSDGAIAIAIALDRAREYEPNGGDEFSIRFG